MKFLSSTNWFVGTERIVFRIHNIHVAGLKDHQKKTLFGALLIQS